MSFLSQRTKADTSSGLIFKGKFGGMNPRLNQVDADRSADTKNSQNSYFKGINHR
jgi:hypothetical protein